MGANRGAWREIFNSRPSFGGYDSGNPARTLYVQTTAGLTSISPNERIDVREND